MAAPAKARRPFWMHQLAEYIFGAALVATGFQSPTPVAPCIVGGLVMVHAAITTGPMAAFRVLGRRTHRVVDVGVIGCELVAAVQPAVSVDSGTRLIMFGIAVVHGFVWWQTSYAERPPRAQRRADAAAAAAAAGPLEGDRSTDIGRKAGRVVANGVNLYRRSKPRERP